MGAPSGLSPVARRQISAAPGFPRMRIETSVTTRLAGARPVGLLVSGITLPDGEPAVLLALPANHGASRAPAEIARQAVSGFSDANSYAALIDEAGRVEAASEGFEGLGIAQATLDSLVAEVRGEEDRFVKRLIPAEAATLAAGMARLTDDPARHLLLVIEAEDVALPAPDMAEEMVAPREAVEDDPVPEAEPLSATLDAGTEAEPEAEAAGSERHDDEVEAADTMAGAPEPVPKSEIPSPRRRRTRRSLRMPMGGRPLRRRRGSRGPRPKSATGPCASCGAPMPMAASPAFPTSSPWRSAWKPTGSAAAPSAR
jgi:hypothetical protein